MRNWLTFTAVSTLMFALAVTIVIHAYRTEIPARQIDPDSKYLPGNMLPGNAYCDWQLSGSSARYCVAMPETGQHIAFDIDNKTGIITRTTVSNRDMTIGDLMLIWGEPIGYMKMGFVTQVYWQNRSAYITVSSLTPRSPIVFTSYYQETPDALAWKGLVNGR